jgi:hypothetical protein
MSGGARINVSNPVYLANNSRFITIGGALDGTEPVALVQPAPSFDFIGRPFIQWEGGLSDPLPIDRFTLTSGWTADEDGILSVNALDLEGPGESVAAYLSRGNVHFYRFTTEGSAQYTVTRAGDSGIYTAAAWEDDGVSQITGTTSTSTSTAFPAIARPGENIIIMVYGGTGDYEVEYDVVP